MKTILLPKPTIKHLILSALFMVASITAWAQNDTCKVPMIPSLFSVTETHSDVPQSFWQNGGHIPENTVDEDSTNYARAHIKATGSATLRISADTIMTAETFAGFYVKSRAFRDADFSGITINTYLNGVLQESYAGDDLWVEYIPFFVNDPICIGFFTSTAWNQVEIIFSADGPRVHYDVFYAVTMEECEINESLPPGWTTGDTCKMPIIPPVFSVTETHSDIPQSFWQNGGHIPANTVDEDTTNFARAHIKATGSATLRVSALDTVISAGTFAGFYIQSRAFVYEDFSGITIKTYLNGVIQESFTGDDLLVEYIPTSNTDPIAIGFITIRTWNEIEVIFSAEGPKVHYDVFYALTLMDCDDITGELPPGLPVTWVSFEVQKKGEASDLKWITAQEFNNAGFQVERSHDGRFFEPIGNVEPVSFSRNVNSYSFMDMHPLKGNNYYRIKQIDLDGKAMYSPIRNLSFATLTAELQSWPNPVSGSLYVQIPEDVASEGQIRIINSIGTVVHTERYENPNSQLMIDISRIDPGNYHLVIETATNQYYKQIVVLD